MLNGLCTHTYARTHTQTHTNTNKHTHTHRYATTPSCLSARKSGLPSSSLSPPTTFPNFSSNKVFHSHFIHFLPILHSFNLSPPHLTFLYLFLNLHHHPTTQASRATANDRACQADSFTCSTASTSITPSSLPHPHRLLQLSFHHLPLLFFHPNLRFSFHQHLLLHLLSLLPASLSPAS